MSYAGKRTLAGIIHLRGSYIKNAGLMYHLNLMLL